MTILFVLTIGAVLWVGVLSDSTNQLTMPGLDSIAYVASVVIVVAVLAHLDRGRSTSRNNGKGESRRRAK